MCKYIMILLLGLTTSILSAQKYRVVAIPVNYSYKYNDGYSDGSGTCTSCWNYATRYPGLLHPETMNLIADGYVTDEEAIPVSFYETRSKTESRPFKQIDYCTSSAYKDWDAYTGRREPYCQARINRQDAVLTPGTPLQFGNHSSEFLSNPDHSGALSFMKTWLLPNVSSYKGSLGYCEPVFDVPGIKVAGGHWELLGDQDTEWTDLDGPFHDRYPLDITLEELDQGSSRDLRSLKHLKLRFVISANGGGSFHGFHTVNAFSESEQVGKGSVVLGSYNFTLYQCSPDLLTQPEPFEVLCYGESNGSFALNYSRVLEQQYDEKMLVMLYQVIGSGFEFIESKTLSAPDLPGGKFIWPSVLPPASYMVRWMTKEGAADYSSIPDAVKESEPFTIREPDPLQLTLNVVPVRCKGQADGSVEAETGGGTSPFQYSLDGVSWKDTGMFSGLSAGNYTLYVKDSNGCQTASSFQMDEPQSAPEISLIRVSEPTAHGVEDGFVNLLVFGGQKPYSYYWFKDEAPYSKGESISGLGAGFYSFYAVDANDCRTATLELSITEPDPLELMFIVEKDSLACADETTILQVQGLGSASAFDDSYTYLWSDGVTDPVRYQAEAGNYEVSVFDKYGNQVSDNYFIYSPEPIQATIHKTDVGCKGVSNGSLFAEIRGGTPPYQVTWYSLTDREFTKSGIRVADLPAGEYYYEIVDSKGCYLTNRQSIPVILTEPFQEVHLSEVILHDITAFNDQDGSIEVRVSGGTPPYSYNWIGPDGFLAETSTISDLTAGAYTLMVTDQNAGADLLAGCILIEEFEIHMPEPLEVTLQVLTQVGCSGENNGEILGRIQGGVAPYRYKWYRLKDGEKALMEIENTVAEGLGGGDYFLEVTDDHGVRSSSDTVTLVDPLPLEIVLKNIIPATCNRSADGVIALTLVGGAPPYEIIWDNGQTGSTLQGVTAGNYLVTVTDSFGCEVVAEYDLEAMNSLDLIVSNQNNIGSYGANNGSVEFLIEGGQPPFQWFLNEEWVMESHSREQQFEQMGTGQHRFRVRDATGCFDEELIHLEQPPQISINTTMPSCEGSCNGAIEVVINDPEVMNIGFVWSHGSREQRLTNLCEGEYIVEVYAENVLLEQISIELLPATDLKVGIPEEVWVCEGGMIYLEAGAPKQNIHYEWWLQTELLGTERGIELSREGEYLLKVISGECQYSRAFDLKIFRGQMKPEFLIATHAYTNEEIIGVDVTNPVPESVTWHLPDQARLYQRSNDAITLSFSAPGTYEIAMTANNGTCQSTVYKTVVVSEAEYGTGSAQQAQQLMISKLQVYPNPAADHVVVELELPEVSELSLKIFNLGNNQVIAQLKDNGERSYRKQIDLGMAPPGIYALVVETGLGSRVYKLVKK